MDGERVPILSRPCALYHYHIGTLRIPPNAVEMLTPEVFAGSATKMSREAIRIHPQNQH